MLNTLKFYIEMLDNILYSNKSNDVTLYSLYPLTDTPMVQPILRLFKNHLMGLFLLELNLLVPYRKQGKLQSKGSEKWNALIATKQNYSSIKSKIKGTTTIELSVNPVNAEDVKKRKQLTNAEKSCLKELRWKYITHCNEKVDAEKDDNVDAEKGDGASNKCHSAAINQNTSETIPNLSNNHVLESGLVNPFPTD